MKKSSLDKQKKNKIWGGRFSSSPNELMEEFNSSIQFDLSMLLLGFYQLLGHFF